MFQQAASNLSVKRAALADSKTGMPVFQPYTLNPTHFQNFAQTAPLHHSQMQHLTLAQHPQNAAINYSALNFALPYGTYPATFTMPCKNML